MSGKSNQERISDAQEAIQSLESQLERLEDKASEVESKLEKKKNNLQKIASNKKQSDEKLKSIQNTKKEVNSKKNEVNKIQKEIEELKSSLDKKLRDSEVKKEEIDKFFTKVFGEENEDGERKGGLKKRLETQEDNLDQFLENKKDEIDEFLNTQEKEYDELKQEIESLLPGAASTGLATAFFDQKQNYNFPKLAWSAVFIGAIVGIIVTGLPGYQQATDIYSAAQTLIAKLPFLIAFIWLGTFSAKRFKENRRLQEEYAHKEVLAKTYIGYNKENFANNEDASEMLDKALIEAFSENPGRLMDDVSNNERPSVFDRLSEGFSNKNPN